MATHLAWLAGPLLIIAAVAACQDSSMTSGNPVGAADLVTASSHVTRTVFHGNGVNGGVWWYSSDPSGDYVSGNLSVFTGASDSLTSTTKAFLSYYEARCDVYSNCIYSSGYGLIPAEDLQSTGLSNKRLHLSTNTSDNPDFFATTPGMVIMDWDATGVWSASSKGINTYTSAGFTQKQEGSISYSSATATGSIVGVPIPLGADGSIGSSHNLIITVTR